MQRRFFFLIDFPTNFHYQMSLTNPSAKTGDLKLCFEYIYLFLVLLLSRDAHSHTAVCFPFRGKIAAKLNDANNKLTRDEKLDLPHF